MCKSKQISGILTITSFLLNFFDLLEIFLVCNFDVGMENNWNDNVFCKSDPLPQLCPWKVLHPNNVILSTPTNALPFYWDIFKVHVAGSLISSGFLMIPLIRLAKFLDYFSSVNTHFESIIVYLEKMLYIYHKPFISGLKKLAQNFSDLLKVTQTLKGKLRC